MNHGTTGDYFHRANFYSLIAVLIWLTGCSSDDAPKAMDRPERSASDGPQIAGPAMPHRRGNAEAGRDVFRFETFGNEGFWTDAMRMPQGMKDAKVTPLDALKAGVTVDVDAIEPEKISPH